MKSIATMALKEGMILAEDIVSFQGKTIIREGTSVTRELINRLNRYSIMCVNIRESEDLSDSEKEHSHSCQSYKTFETVYMNTLNAFKYVIQNLLQNQSPVNTSYLLTIHDHVFEECDPKAQALTILSELVVPDEDRLYAHMLNAALISTIFGEWIGLDSKNLKLLTLCGYFFDIGRLRLPEKRLAQVSKRTPEDEKLIQTHTMLGYDLLQYQNLNDCIRQCTLHHHERCDGSGYPDGLSGHAIDLFSKYIAIVDTYEVMMSAQIHGRRLTPFQVIRNFELQGQGKYDASALGTILAKIAELQIGRKVLLNNDTTAEITSIHRDALSYPILRQTGGDTIDLLQDPELTIIEML